jgi:hypothetical protein
MDVDAVKDHLRRAGLLIPGSTGDVPSVEKYRSGASPARFYVLARSFIGDVTA